MAVTYCLPPHQVDSHKAERVVVTVAVGVVTVAVGVVTVALGVVTVAVAVGVVTEEKKKKKTKRGKIGSQVTLEIQNSQTNMLKCKSFYVKDIYV